MKKLIKIFIVFLVNLVKLNLYWNIISYFFLIPLFTIPLYIVEFYCNKVGLLFDQTLLFFVLKYFLWFFKFFDKLTEISVFFEPFVFESEFCLFQTSPLGDNSIKLEFLDDCLINDGTVVTTRSVVVDFSELADLKMYKLSIKQVINQSQNFNNFVTINL